MAVFSHASAISRLDCLGSRRENLHRHGPRDGSPRPSPASSGEQPLVRSHDRGFGLIYGQTSVIGDSILRCGGLSVVHLFDGLSPNRRDTVFNFNWACLFKEQRALDRLLFL